MYWSRSRSLIKKLSTRLEGSVFLGVFGVVEAMVNIWWTESAIIERLPKTTIPCSYLLISHIDEAIVRYHSSLFLTATFSGVP